MLDADTLIVEASAAGLATAACLKQADQSFEILEATDVVGNAWRQHYDRFHLHTPKSTSAPPGLKMPREWPRYPARLQVVDYLEHYRAGLYTFKFQHTLGVGVLAVDHDQG